MSEITFSKADRQARRECIFGSVSELSDLSFQRATWLDPEMQNPHYSFVEFFESFYDIAAGSYDSAHKDAPDAPFSLDADQGVLTLAERDAVWQVHLALKAYEEPGGDAYDHAGILSDPAWHAVVEVASEAVAALKGILDDPDDLRTFENLLPSSANKRWP